MTKIGKLRQKIADFTYYLFTIHSSLFWGADFWEVIGNSEEVGCEGGGWYGQPIAGEIEGFCVADYQGRS